MSNKTPKRSFINKKLFHEFVYIFNVNKLYHNFHTKKKFSIYDKHCFSINLLYNNFFIYNKIEIKLSLCQYCNEIYIDYIFNNLNKINYDNYKEKEIILSSYYNDFFTKDISNYKFAPNLTKKSCEILYKFKKKYKLSIYGNGITIDFLFFLIKNTLIFNNFIVELNFSRKKEFLNIKKIDDNLFNQKNLYYSFPIEFLTKNLSQKNILKKISIIGYKIQDDTSFFLELNKLLDICNLREVQCDSINKNFLDIINNIILKRLNP